MGCCGSREKDPTTLPYSQPEGVSSILKRGTSSNGSNKGVSFNDARNEEFTLPDIDEYEHQINNNNNNNNNNNSNNNSNNDDRFINEDGSISCPKCTAVIAVDAKKCPGCKSNAEEMRKLNMQAGVKRRLSVSGAKLAARNQA